MPHNITGYKAVTHYPMTSQFRGMKTGSANTSYTKDMRPGTVKNGEPKPAQNMTLKEQLMLLEQEATNDSIRKETIEEIEKEAETAKENEITRNMLQ